MTHEDISASIDRAIAAVKSQKLIHALHQKEHWYICQPSCTRRYRLSLEEQKELSQLIKISKCRYKRLETQIHMHSEYKT